MAVIDSYSKTLLTPVEPALHGLAIQMIGANSLQARGRSESISGPG